MNEQTCTYCKGKLEEQRVTRFQEYEGEYFILENVPALVCEQCGEVYYTPEAHDLVIRLITGHDKPARVEAIKVYDAGVA